MFYRSQNELNQSNDIILLCENKHLLSGFMLQDISKPAAWHRFGADSEEAEDDPGSYFISAVCWKSDSPTMLTANSRGTIKVLVLAA